MTTLRDMTEETSSRLRQAFAPLGRISAGLMAAAALLMAPAGAQELESFDPDEAYAQEVEQNEAASSATSAGTDWAIDGDLDGETYTSPRAPVPVQPQSGPAEVVTNSPGFDDEFAPYGPAAGEGDTASAQVGEPVPQWSDPASNQAAADPATGEQVASADSAPATYGEDDLIGAAEGVFGKGAEGLARLIEDLLREQGEPNGYIVGREAGGAFVFGARYGSGTLHHRIEGQRQVYWTGPSLGFDAGANAGNTFVLVYNLYDSEDIFRRYPAGEGQAYFVGGLHASYMRRGDVVLIPIRIGAGLRLGVNAGYMRFSKKQRWLPF